MKERVWSMTKCAESAPRVTKINERRGEMWLVWGMTLLVFLLYASVLQGVVADWWHDENYSHGFLVPVFTGYLLWARWNEIHAMQLDGSWLGLPVIAVGLGMLILGDLAAEHFVSRSSLIVVAAGLVLFHAGSGVLFMLAFPLTFLIFMIPLPAIVFNAIAFPLQGLAAENATWALDRLGVPALRDGNVIHLSQITLGVTEACSGIRSLISLLALAVAWGYLTIRGVGWQLLFVASAVPITIIANAGRVIATGLIGQYFGIEYAQGFFHAFSGWIVFVVAFVALLGVHAAIAVTSRIVHRGGRSER